MIGILFGINTGLALIVSFTTSMLQNHFNKISRSVDIYLNPKAYKPESEIAFIRDLIEKYEFIYHTREDETIEVATMIKNVFYKLKIGKFSYIAIQNIAVQSKFLMWALLCAQILMQIFNPVQERFISHLILIIASGLLCGLVTLMGILKNVVEQRKALFIKIEDFLVNVYPTQMKWKDKQKDVQVLLSRIEALETELEKRHTDKSSMTQEIELEIGQAHKEVDLEINKAEDKQTSQDIQTKEAFIKEEDIKILLSKIDL